MDNATMTPEQHALLMQAGRDPMWAATEIERLREKLALADEIRQMQSGTIAILQADKAFMEAELAALRPLKPIAEAAMFHHRMAEIGTKRRDACTEQELSDYHDWLINGRDEVGEAIEAYLAAQEGGEK